MIANYAEVPGVGKFNAGFQQVSTFCCYIDLFKFAKIFHFRETPMIEIQQRNE